MLPTLPELYHDAYAELPDGGSLKHVLRRQIPSEVPAKFVWLRTIGNDELGTEEYFEVDGRPSPAGTDTPVWHVHDALRELLAQGPTARPPDDHEMLAGALMRLRSEMQIGESLEVEIACSKTAQPQGKCHVCWGRHDGRLLQTTEYWSDEFNDGRSLLVGRHLAMALNALIERATETETRT